ncbi:unnamed protein product, partial [Discosporangium mesarthrocarpum]
MGLNRLSPQYRLYFQDKDRLMMTAKKCGKSRRGNYHIFDMNRGG